MANKDWWESFSPADCLKIGSWEDMVDYIQHSACTDFIIHSTCTSTGQAFKFTQYDTLSVLEGSENTGDDLKIKANSFNSYPFIQLNGNADIKLEVNNDEEIYFYENGAQFFLFDRNVTESLLYGGSVTGDDLIIFANATDDYPHVHMDGNAEYIIEVGNEEEIIFKENGAQFFLFDRSGTISQLYGGTITGDDLQIQANNTDTYPYVKLSGNAGILFNVPNEEEIRFFEADDEFFAFDRSGVISKLYGGSTTGDDLQILANSVDNCPMIEMLGNAGMTCKITTTGVFEISTCTDEALWEVDNSLPTDKHFDFHCLDAHNFVLELRTSDPSGPTCTGQIWFRTDLV